MSVTLVTLVTSSMPLYATRAHPTGEGRQVEGLDGQNVMGLLVEILRERRSSDHSTCYTSGEAKFKSKELA